MEVEHQRQQKHGRGLVPERVLALGAFRCGVLEKVGDKALNVVVVSQIDERVVAMAFLHVDEVDHLNVVTLGFQKPARITKQFTLRVQTHKAGVGVHHIWLGKKPCLACAGASAD